MGKRLPLSLVATVPLVDATPSLFVEIIWPRCKIKPRQIMGRSRRCWIARETLEYIVNRNGFTATILREADEVP